MDDDGIAIRVDKVYKDFILPLEKINTVKGVFTHLATLRSLKVKETQHALRDITFDIKKGEFFGIVGRNGSGKSTLLKILAGIYQPNQGSVDVKGKLVPFIELGVGFNAELTGRENVYLNGALLGFTKKEVDAQYDKIVEFAELEEFMDQKLKNYSSGMQVRLAFSVAIRANGDILLVDEVLAVGDSDFQRKCFDYFRGLKKAKKTVVFVSHDMTSVREYCDRAIMIEKSRIIVKGTPDEVATSYSRMFNDASSVTYSKGSKRWGNKDLEIEDLKLSTKKLTEEDANFAIKLKIKANKDVVSPIFGFVIKNQSGLSIVGINTRMQKIDPGKIKKGQTVNVEWKLPNVFADGSYGLDIAILGQDSVTVNDWWEGAEQFLSRQETPSPFPLSPKITTNVTAAK